MRSKVREPSKSEAVALLEEVMQYINKERPYIFFGKTEETFLASVLAEWRDIQDRIEELLNPRTQDSWEVHPDTCEEVYVRSAYPIYQDDDNGEEVGLFYERKDANLAAAANELLRALVGLYNHTKNNNVIGDLNVDAIRAITKAVGDAEYTALLER